MRITPGGAPESYRIAVDAASVVITGADAAGAFYGVQTLGQLIARDGERWVIPRARDRRCPPLRVPRGDARRRAPLPDRRHRQGVHRPCGRTEVQRPAPAPHRRSGLAPPARLPSEADRARLRHVGRRRSGRVLHQGGLRRDRRVRGRAAHDGDPRDRHARSHARRRPGVPRTRRSTRAARARRAARRGADPRAPATPTRGSPSASPRCGSTRRRPTTSSPTCSASWRR